jgi:hypothetical protein
VCLLSAGGFLGTLEWCGSIIPTRNIQYWRPDHKFCIDMPKNVKGNTLGNEDGTDLCKKSLMEEFQAMSMADCCYAFV